jgi:acetoacetyl-CoA reductase
MGAQRVAFVTGGTGGIGTAICKRFCAADIRVAAGCSINSLRKNQWLNDMQAQGYEAFVVEVDVASGESAKAALERVKSAIGPVDILVNNAGITRDKFFRKMALEEWEAVINTNLNCLYCVTKPVLDDMIERGWGRIINISSVNARSASAATQATTSRGGWKRS